ncbi:MAG: hypothetical protein M1839_003542 [Geoglossum umbratile]|nr:MAG: hypothetical protein M1839_003542 [Geoglossum umbratile]
MPVLELPSRPLDDDAVRNTYLYGANGSRRRARMVLDSGANVNLIALGVAGDLGLELRPSNVVISSVFGQATEVIGELTIEWTFRGAPDREAYRYTFYVIDTTMFDALASLEFIRESGAFTFNHEVVGE